MAMGWFGVALVFQVAILATFVPSGFGMPRVCVGETCFAHDALPVNPKLDVLGAYCVDICYGNVKNIYNTTCDCDSIITSTTIPCARTYLQEAVCDWSRRACNGSKYCEWRKKQSLAILSSENMKGICDCPLREMEMKDPCEWEQSETTLCSVLKETQMLYDNFQCVCDANIPTLPPSTTNVCEYTKHRPADLSPVRRKRLFAGHEAYSCNYPGVVGLFVNLDSNRTSLCTATLLDKDTILFDQQCKTALKNPVYALVNSYDASSVTGGNPTVDLNTITHVDSHSAANALFTAKLHSPVVYDDKCALPACLPNVRTPAHHIDLNDCRVLGYGDTSDTFITGRQAKKLKEIKVKVKQTSIAADVLEVIRYDGYRNTACLNEFSAPLVCAHKHTKEWITVGVHQYIGVVCSGKTKPYVFQVSNLLSEAMGNHYYKDLKSYQPKQTAIPS